MCKNQQVFIGPPICTESLVTADQLSTTCHQTLLEHSGPTGTSHVHVASEQQLVEVSVDAVGL